LDRVGDLTTRDDPTSDEDLQRSPSRLEANAIYLQAQVNSLTPADIFVNLHF
jgi:hypothetical protein